MARPARLRAQGVTEPAAHLGDLVQDPAVVGVEIGCRLEHAPMMS
ncbi:hypothetical protein SFR_3179 [Streptomyces sp. FR-008]|nr:hypothetical protein SFR_3179 [Streptomyces sp. FR-008]